MRRAGIRALPPAFARHHEWRPIGRRSPLAYKREHRVLHRLRPAEIWLFLHGGHRAAYELYRGVGVHRPVRDQYRPCACVEKGAREPRERLAVILAAGRCVAS